MKKYITLNEIIKISLEKYNKKFKLLAGAKGIENKINTILINRPGITLSGYFKNFAYNRIQIFGKGEHSYLNDMPEAKLESLLKKFFDYKIPCIFFSHNLLPNKKFIEIANQKNVPVLSCKLSTSELISLLTSVLSDKLAPTRTLHGVLIEVFGIGVLILGESGIGKSETALELISKGHRLVADDVIVIKKISNSLLIGSGDKMVQHYMEIRGLGIIDIKSLFGIGAVRESKRIDMVVLLEEWKKKKEYERLGITEKNYKIMGVNLPLYIIPVKPGRNIPILIETAAKNLRLKQMRIIPVKELESKIFKKV